MGPPMALHPVPASASQSFSFSSHAVLAEAKSAERTARQLLRPVVARLARVEAQVREMRDDLSPLVAAVNDVPHEGSLGGSVNELLLRRRPQSPGSATLEGKMTEVALVDIRKVVADNHAAGASFCSLGPTTYASADRQDSFGASEIESEFLPPFFDMAAEDSDSTPFTLREYLQEERTTREEQLQALQGLLEGSLSEHRSTVAQFVDHVERVEQSLKDSQERHFFLEKAVGQLSERNIAMKIDIQESSAQSQTTLHKMLCVQERLSALEMKLPYLELTDASRLAPPQRLQDVQAHRAISERVEDCRSRELRFGMASCVSKCVLSDSICQLDPLDPQGWDFEALSTTAVH